MESYTNRDEFSSLDNNDTTDEARQAANGQAPIPLASLTTTLETFVELHQRGFWAVLIHPGKKRPIYNGWGVERWTIEKAMKLIKKFPGAGVGVCLGPGRAPGDGWLTDLEGDGPEAEESRAKLFGGEIIETMGWGSARGGHPLFLGDPGRLKTIAAGLKRFQVKDANQPGVFHLPQLPGLELRIGGYTQKGTVKQVQSVVPPTPGTDGKPRQWNGVETVADLPEAAYAFLEAVVAEIQGEARVERPDALRTTPAARTRARVRGKNRADAWLTNALQNAAARIEATVPGERRNKYRDEAYQLAGYLHYNEQYGVGFTEEELRTTLKASLAVGVRPDDPVVDETVDDSINDGKAAPLTLKPELHLAATTGQNGPLQSDFSDDQRDEAEWLGRTYAAATSTLPTTDGDGASHDDAQAAEPLPTELTLIAKAMVQDLNERRIAFYSSSTGSGKTFAIAQTAVDRYQQGLVTLIAFPTLRLMDETLKLLARMDRSAFEADAIAVCGGGRLRSAIDSENDTDEDDPGKYPIHEATRIILCTHAQLGRKGLSRYIRPIWSKLDRNNNKNHPRPAAALIIDEVGDYIRSIRVALNLAHRVKRRREADGSGSTLVPVPDCPKSNHSGNCSNCELVKQGGDIRFNRFTIREISPPRQVDMNEKGERFGKPRKPLEVTDNDIGKGIDIKVGYTTWAASLLEWKGSPLSLFSYRHTAIQAFMKAENGKHPHEEPHEALGHMLEFAFRPVITRDHPVNEENAPVASDLLRLRIDMESKGIGTSKGIPWDDGITFPLTACEVPWLRFADLISLEKMRRFTREQSVGLIFAGAVITDDDRAVLHHVWPDLIERNPPYPDRKISQAAVVFLEGHQGFGSLVGSKSQLATKPLESVGKGVVGLVFCSRKRIAITLYDAIKHYHPTVRLASENNETMNLSGSLHERQEAKCLITYSRGVLGLGANMNGLRFLVLDALAFRSVASFTPGVLSPEDFELARAEERLALILQNLGRAIRGEKGKTVVIIVMNADEKLREAIKASPALIVGSDLPPVFTSSSDIIQVVDQALRWLNADGGEWPQPDPKTASKKRPGRPAKRTKEDVLEAAEDALKAGTRWTEFVRREHVQRLLSVTETAELKARFSRAGESGERDVFDDEATGKDE